MEGDMAVSPEVHSKLVPPGHAYILCGGLGVSNSDPDHYYLVTVQAVLFKGERPDGQREGEAARSLPAQTELSAQGGSAAGSAAPDADTDQGASESL